MIQAQVPERIQDTPIYTPNIQWFLIIFPINKMEATNPNVFTFLDYECKPLQKEN